MGVTLITGASGFIGSHLVADMRRRGLPIRPVSRREAPGITKIGSYTAETDWQPHLQDVDHIVHLAARVHVMRETDADPLTAFRRANVDATLNLARQAASAGVKRFIFMSTIKVNGEETKPGKPFTNSDPPNPQDPYAISKAEAETGLAEIGQQSGMEFTIIRPPLVYGPGVGGNFATLLRWAKLGLPSIFPRVENKRSLIYVGNLTDFAIKALNHPGAANRHFLVSDGTPLSTHQLVFKLLVACGNKPRSVPVPLTAFKWAGSIAGKEQMIERLLNSLEIDDRETRDTLSWNEPFGLEVSLRAGP
ncbi:MAG: NAD-dependent epimerase/dehydratase family protein [Rhizobium sp.]|nr:NAD-dependent epimerase/dehydratase family protein [Rhizobium sp.]